MSGGEAGFRKFEKQIVCPVLLNHQGALPNPNPICKQMHTRDAIPNLHDDSQNFMMMMMMMVVMMSLLYMSTKWSSGIHLVVELAC